MTENTPVPAVEPHPIPVLPTVPQHPLLAQDEPTAEPEGEVKAPAMKRRDLLEVSALLRRHKLDFTDQAAMGLGVQYLQEKRAGETKLSFKEWLDEDLPEDDEDAEVDGDEDPTV